MCKEQEKSHGEWPDHTGRHTTGQMCDFSHRKYLERTAHKDRTWAGGQQELRGERIWKVAEGSGLLLGRAENTRREVVVEQHREGE